MTTKYVMIATSLVALMLAGCDTDRSSGARETQQQMMLTEQAVVTLGLPAIKNFTEKRLLKTIYELRDQANLVTYTYTMDLQGKRHKVCPTTSIGFPIPYSTQYTAPKALQIRRGIYPDGTQGPWQNIEGEQPEPNGLYMPSAAEGTWVVCMHPNGKDMAPTYVEDRVQTFLFERPSID